MAKTKIIDQLSKQLNGRVQQIQLLRSGSVSARCYWCILLDHQLSLLNATIQLLTQLVYNFGFGILGFISRIIELLHISFSKFGTN